MALARPVGARTPEIALDPREGVWITGGEVFIHQSRDRWSVFAAPDVVNQLATDEETVWVATDDGVVRFESGSRRFGALGMDDGLPSLSVTSVAAEDEYVWFGTNKGLARYRKLDRTVRVYTDEEGLPHRAVNDVQVIGRRVWIATRAGLALYDPEVDGLRTYGLDDGLASDFIEELYVVGDDLWARTDTGLSRFETDMRRFTNFSFDDVGGEEIRVFAPDGEQIWVGTENGLSTFQAASDAFIIFPQNAALEDPRIVGVEPFTDYLFIATETEVVQYHKNNRTFRRFTEADGIEREVGAMGTVLNGAYLSLVFEDEVHVYDIQRDLWTRRSLAPTESGDEGGAVTWQAWTRVDSEIPVDLRAGEATDERFTTLAGGVGAGYELDGGRSLDLSVLVDYGELELDGIRDQSVKGEYLGAQDDVVREITLGDALEVKTLDEGVDAPFLLMGAHGRLASPGADPTLSATVDGGMRRGLTRRDFITGPRQQLYQLSERYILPGSERVYLDGELLTAETDYTIIYPAGQLAFLDPERVDDLSIIEVEYEFDVVPKKGLGVISLLDLLPADNEVGSWTRASEPTLVSEESGLYAQIDGAAPKYIDRGWVRSVYAEYQQGSRTIQVAIHDMDTTAQAQQIYDYDLPAAREPIGDRDNAVLDIGLAGSYAAKAWTDSFYIELSIDEKSDPARQLLRLFTVQVLDRGDTAGALDLDVAREVVAMARMAVRPAEGVEIGGRAVQVAGVEDGQLADEGRRQVSGVIDGRYERSFAGSGRVTAYGEAVGSHGQRAGNTDGFAALGRLRLSHPYIEGAALSRYHGRGFSPIGSDATLFGRLRDETRLSATAYPTKWLPTTVFLSRQRSRSAGEEGPGLVQHALARLQLTRPDAPTTMLQVGHTLLDDAAGTETNRMKVVGQADYDLATGILSPLGMRRFILKGLYSYSDAETDNAGVFLRADRVQVSRLEAKLAPTATETAYGLFRWRLSEGRDTGDDRLALAGRHWELNAGARSSVVPGLIPQVNQSVIYDHDRTGEAGPTRSANSTISGQLGIFPGEWWAPLTPIAIEPRYSLSNEDESKNGIRTTARRLHRLDNRMSYNGMAKLTVELQEVYAVSTAGRERETDELRLELRNRVIYRPTHTSPIQFRLDYFSERILNDRIAATNASKWGVVDTWESALEWLMRWDRRWTTRLRGTVTRTQTRHQVFVDESTGAAAERTFRQIQIKPESEVRYLLQDDDGSLFIVQRSIWLVSYGGMGMSTGQSLSVGLIWSVGDNLYLDGEVAWNQIDCLVEPCSPSHGLEPRLLLTARL